tara:strand:- start:40 stop:249 length:210 start_codon:yes stop_codon:yes gene_type:complete
MQNLKLNFLKNIRFNYVVYALTGISTLLLAPTEAGRRRQRVAYLVTGAACTAAMLFSVDFGPILTVLLD